MAQELDTVHGEAALKGVVLCCTSLPQDVRIKLADAAVQMGAVHKLDLTSDVTHLIVGSIATPKYKYVAKERPDIKVLHPDWIEAVRTEWIQGGEVNVEALERQHRLPTFHGLEICLTGFDNLAQRESIRTGIIDEGAEYHGDLIKMVTHLIALVPEGKKYAAAKSWGLHVVSLKWYEDSLSRGMAVDESLYNPALPLEEQGIGAFRLQPRTHRTSLGKRGREGEAEALAEPSKKKFRRTASTKLESQSQDMWQDISSYSAGVENSTMDQWMDHDDRPAADIVEESSVVRRIAQAEPADEAPKGLFAGSHILLRGFEQKRRDRLQQYLEPNGAHVVYTAAELDDASSKPFFRHRYQLVPHARPDVELSLTSMPTGTLTVTEWWVERCIHYKRLLDPNDDILSTPLWFDKVTAFEHVSIATTGFGSRGIELREVAEAVKLLGASYQEQISPNTSVLICASTNVKKEKLYYAQKHAVPVVSAEWLWMCLRKVAKVPLGEFEMQVPPMNLADVGGETSTSTPAGSDIQQPGTKEEKNRKDERHSKRLSTTRRKQATPSLSLQTLRPKSPPLLKKKPQPIFHEDDDDDVQLVPTEPLPTPTAAKPYKRASQPLQELSPNLSPRKSSQLAADKEGKPVASTATLPHPQKLFHFPDHVAEAYEQASMGPRPELEADIQALIHRSAVSLSRPNSASGRQHPPKRKSRPLGRAPSCISNRSASMSNQSDQTLQAFPSEEVADSLGHDSSIAREAPLPPSTQLGYETADAETHRLQMSKMMGTKLEDDEGGLKRVASLGVVKDNTMTTDAGVGNRVRGRHKPK